MSAPIVSHLEPDSVRRAAEILGNGGIVALPTETVYGLGADASNDAAVAKIFAAKGRPADHPLIEDIKRKDFVASRHLDDEVLLGAGVVGAIEAELVALAPLVDYLCAALDLEF